MEDVMSREKFNHLLSKSKHGINRGVKKIVGFNGFRPLLSTFIKREDQESCTFHVDGYSGKESKLTISSNPSRDGARPWLNFFFLLDYDRINRDYIRSGGVKSSHDAVVLECLRVFLYSYYGYGSERYKDHNKEVLRASVEIVINRVLELDGDNHLRAHHLSLPDGLNIDQYYLILSSMLEEESGGNEESDSSEEGEDSQPGNESGPGGPGGSGESLGETGTNEPSERGPTPAIDFVKQDEEIDASVLEDSKQEVSYSNADGISEVLDRLSESEDVEIRIDKESEEAMEDSTNKNVKDKSIKAMADRNTTSEKQVISELGADLKAILNNIINKESSMSNVFYDYERSWPRINNRRSKICSNLLTPGRERSTGRRNTKFDKRPIVFIDKSLSTKEISEQINYIGYIIKERLGAVIATYAGGLQKVYNPGDGSAINDRVYGTTSIENAVREYGEVYGSLCDKRVYVITDGDDRFDNVLTQCDARIIVISRDGTFKRKIDSKNYDPEEERRRRRPARHPHSRLTSRVN